MKRWFFLIFCFSFFSAFPQAVIHFDTRIHDFGAIEEMNGIVTYQFEFTNQGMSPILIKKVESSCGCTSPEWSKQPVLPGKKGFIKAIFNPQNRPGYFDKTITVYSNAHPGMVELKIKGTVKGKTRTILDDYPYELPSGLRLPLEEISLMKVHKGEVKSLVMEVFNNAGKQVEVDFSEVPAYLQISIEPRSIRDKTKATLKAAYNTAMHGEYGLNRENITLIVDGKRYRFPVSVFIEENFKDVDFTAAPVIEADKKYYNFDRIQRREVASFSYQIKNTGKSLLKIHRLYTNDGRIVAEIDKKELQPGEIATVSVKSAPEAEIGKVMAVISVISNSPFTPELRLRFYGEIY